jgi:hypothetical protein
VTAPAAPPGAAAQRWLPIGELLDLDDSHGGPCLRAFNRVATARKLYCGLEEVPLARALPCAGCGRLSVQLVGGIPLHLTCPDPAPGWPPSSGPHLEEDQAPGEGAEAGTGPARHETETGPGAAEGTVTVTQAPEILVAVLAADGLWLPGAGTPIAVAWPRDAGEAYRLAARYRVRQLWIHPGAHEALGLPGRHGPNPQAPEEHPWAQPDGYACDPPGLAAWMQVAPVGGGRRRAVVLAGYENRASWQDAPDGRVLLAAVTAFAEAMPGACNYYYSPNVTAAAVIRHHHRGGLEPARLPPPAVDRVVTHVASWSRTLLDEESECRWLHRYDVHGAQLATWNVKLGVGDPVHDSAPQWVPRKSKYTAGYWLVSLPAGWRPDGRLPNLLRPWERAGEERIWVPTPFLELLINDLTAPVTLHEAWTWPVSSAWLEASGRSFRDARAALDAQADGCGKCAPCIALRVVKDIYTSAIGRFARRRNAPDDEDDSQPGGGKPQRKVIGGLVAADDPLQREDVNDHIISKSLCNDYRRQARIGAATNRWPVAIFNDAVYYASDDPDGPGAIPAGMVIGHGLGQYSHEATALLTAVAGELGERGFHRAVERHLRGNR